MTRFMNFMLNLMNNTLIYQEIAPGGCYYSLKLNKEIPLNIPQSDLNRYARAFYFKGKEPAYFISDGKKAYLVPEYYSQIN